MCFPSRRRRAAAREQRLTDFSALQRAGAVAVTDDGKPILEDDVMRMALRLGAELNLASGAACGRHAADRELLDACGRNQLSPGPARHARQRPKRDRGARCHAGAADSRIAAARGASFDVGRAEGGAAGKRAKARVTCEVTPHHFSLIDENVGEYDTHFKMNPPLRSAADREAIVVALADGTVDAIATDHAPHAAHEKQVEFERAAFGITGLETALAAGDHATASRAQNPADAHRRTVHRRSGARVRPETARVAGPRQLWRCDDLRSQEALDDLRRRNRDRFRAILHLTAGNSPEKLWRRSWTERSCTWPLRAISSCVCSELAN